MSEKLGYEVIASSIDKVHIEFECPFCYTKYKKDREPYKMAKHKFHLHGSSGDLKNRVEGRSPHCNSNRFPFDKYHSFNIKITDETIRE